MNCPDCTERFPSEGILRRHREHDHPEEYAADVQRAEDERAQKTAAIEEDNRFTKDGFLKATGRRKSAPSLYPQFPSATQPMSPWDREAADLDS